MQARGVRVALVDDDPLFREAVRQNLSQAGMQVVEFPGGRDAVRGLIDSAGIDLVLLDWKMPDLSGIEVLRRLRDAGNSVPVIFLTALGEQIYEEVALGSGAVDFIEKARGFTILRRRIDLILGGARNRADRDSQSEAFRLGSLVIRPDSGRAQWNEREVDLTATEFAIVEYLARRAGTDVRYRDLYDLVRGPGFVAGSGPEGYRANVRTFIKRIREKFRAVDPGFDQIENYPTFGYRWIGDGNAAA